MRKPPENQPCVLCGRRVNLTFHHLIPKKLHRRPRFRKGYSRDDLQQGIWVCRACHSGVHRLYDEMALGTRLNTLNSLQQDEAVQRHVRWVSRQRRARV